MPGKPSQAAGVGAGTGPSAPAVAASSSGSPSPGNSSPGSSGTGSRGNDKDRKREEARVRQIRAQKLGPLEKKVATLEAKIAELEAEQKRASTGLADSETYADATKRARLLELYRTSSDALETATMQWELAVGELESAKAAFDAGSGTSTGPR